MDTMGVIATMVIESATTTGVFLAFLYDVLFPVL